MEQKRTSRVEAIFRDVTEETESWSERAFHYDAGLRRGLIMFSSPTIKGTAVSDWRVPTPSTTTVEEMKNCIGLCVVMMADYVARGLKIDRVEDAAPVRHR